jgi:hypothetical protein
MTAQPLEEAENHPTQLIELDPRRRLTLRLGHHNRYLATEEPDGTIVLQPAVVMTADEIALLRAPWLVDQINQNLQDPHAHGTRRRLPTER